MNNKMEAIGNAATQLVKMFGNNPGSTMAEASHKLETV